MPEQITITVSVDQAEAVVDACNCVDLLADGEHDEVIALYAPEGTPEASESDRFRRRQAGLAQQVAGLLRPEIDGAYKRDPQLQEFLHEFKMYLKHGPRED